MDNVHCINVDLEIKSKTDLSSIVDGFGDDAIVMYNGKWGKYFLAAFENPNNSGVNENIKYFCKLVGCLDGTAKKIWDESFSKVFDIGFQSGSNPPSYSIHLEPSVLDGVIKVGAGITITVYPTEK